MGGAAGAGVAADTDLGSGNAPDGPAATAFASVTTGAPFVAATEALLLAAVLATAGSAFAAAGERAVLELDGVGDLVDAGVGTSDAVWGDAAFAVGGGGWNTPSVSGAALPGVMLSRVTVGNTLGAVPDFADVAAAYGLLFAEIVGALGTAGSAFAMDAECTALEPDDGGDWVALADDCGGSGDFMFNSGRFEGVDMLMSATMSFRTKANP